MIFLNAAIDKFLPDLMPEQFSANDDCCAFKPKGEENERDD